LHIERLANADAAPTRWLAIAHGMYGSGTNWRGIARKIHAARPEWGMLLVDLRQHGRSEAGEPPHTVAACAEDVRVALAELGLPIGAIAGHSFGGKVMMAARALVRPAQTWVLDASPSPRGGDPADERNEAVRVLETMSQLPATWPTRAAFVEAIVAAGFTPALANWLAMNVVASPSDPHAYVNRLDLAAMRAMIADYAATDLWDAVLAAEPGSVDVIVGGASATVNADDLARLAEAPAHVRVHVIPGAGHWLHLDAPAAVVELFVARLP
jgi:pimeloyl-ACP methyl ester carboxylesterase